MALRSRSRAVKAPGSSFADEDLEGYVALDFEAFDAWLEEDQPIIGHPREPFHRVDVLLTSRAVRVEIDGETVAESTRARLVFETSLPTRYYLPREDIRAELHASDLRTYCPYKGEASYWSTTTHENVAWSYEDPLPDMTPLTGLVAFWNERVDVFLDDEPRGRPQGAIADALKDEFSV